VLIVIFVVKFLFLMGCGFAGRGFWWLIFLSVTSSPASCFRSRFYRKSRAGIQTLSNSLDFLGDGRLEETGAPFE